MSMPDENAPTLPNRPDARMPAGEASPFLWEEDAAPLPAPPAPPISQVGQPPRWDVPPPPKAPRQGGSLRGFGVGLGIALVILAVMALGLALYVSLSPATPTAQNGSGATAQSTSVNSQPTPTVTPLAPISTDLAVSLVKQFYTSINSAQYQQAYSLLSSGLQQQQTEQQFAQTWKNTLSVTLQDPITPTTGPGKAVTITATYQQVLNDSAATTKQFTITIVVDYDNKAQPRITQLSKQEVALPTPVPTVTVTVAPPVTPTAPATTTTPQPTPATTPTAGAGTATPNP